MVFFFAFFFAFFKFHDKWLHLPFCEYGGCEPCDLYVRRGWVFGVTIIFSIESSEILLRYGGSLGLRMLGVWTEMGSIEILASAIRIARYFCIDIGIDEVFHYSIAYRYRLSMFLCIADTSISILFLSMINLARC